MTLKGQIKVIQSFRAHTSETVHASYAVMYRKSHMEVQMTLSDLTLDDLESSWKVKFAAKVQTAFKQAHLEALGPS